MPAHAAQRRNRGRIVAMLLSTVLQGCATPQGHQVQQATELGAPFTSVVLNTVDASTASYGFTDVDATPSQVSTLTGTQKALVWLGGYNNSSCSLNWSDDQVRASFAEYRLATAEKITGYFLADEPNTGGNCPEASAQVAARTALVRSLDPNLAHFTLANIDNPGQFAAFHQSVDVLSTDPYPCMVGKPCDWTQIPAYIAQLRSAGVVRYMAMLQAFSGDAWRWPTAAELERMIAQWQSSDWCGELTFSWSYKGASLADHPDLLAVLRHLNATPEKPVHPCST